MSDSVVYREHVEQLAQEHGVELTFFEPDPDRGWVARCFPGLAYPVARQPRVETPDPVDRSAYPAGLHEFGHVLGGEFTGPGVRPMAHTPA
jgi:hypothetical protein